MAAVHLDGAGVHLHLAHLAGGEAVLEAQGVRALARRLRHGRLHLRGGQGVDVRDAQRGQLLVRVAVIGAGGGVGLHDAARGRVDEELHGQVLLEDLAVDALAARRAVDGFVHDAVTRRSGPIAPEDLRTPDGPPTERN